MTILENNPLQGLTGRRRYRSTAEGLILQVEDYYWQDAHWSFEWRDAAPRDVLGFEVV
jgi:hypothetical protein